MAKYYDYEDTLPNTVCVMKSRIVTWGRDITNNIHEINKYIYIYIYIYIYTQSVSENT